MRLIQLLILSAVFSGCSYQGSEIFRRNTCNSVLDDAERAKCIEQATQSENAYKQDVQKATTK